MRTDKEILASLLKLIRYYTDDHIIISGDTQIEFELGITGDDAYDLLVSISSHFNMDTKDFNFDTYFCPEPIWFADKSIPLGKKELTVNDLVNAIKKGKLE